MRDLHYYTVQSVILNFDRHLILNLFERFVKVTSRRGTVEAKATIIQSAIYRDWKLSRQLNWLGANGDLTPVFADASVNLLTNPAFSETR